MTSDYIPNFPMEVCFLCLEWSVNFLLLLSEYKHHERENIVLLVLCTQSPFNDCELADVAKPPGRMVVVSVWVTMVSSARSGFN